MALAGLLSNSLEVNLNGHSWCLVVYLFCAVVFLTTSVSIEKITRQIESPYYFFIVTLGDGFVFSVKRNRKGFFAAIYIRMIDFWMFPSVSDFKSTVVI